MEPTKTPHKPLVKGDDHLSTLIAELLVEVLSHVPSKDFRSLVHTNQSLRQFLRENAASICNKAVQNLLTKHVVDPEIFPTTLVKGWLVPTAPVFTYKERIYRADVPALFATWTRLTSPVNPGIKVSQPGPQFLLFLEDYGKHVLPLYGIDAEHDEGRNKPSDSAETTKLNKIWRELRADLVLVDLRRFYKFANGQSIASSTSRALTIPPKVGRCFVWYYGSGNESTMGTDSATRLNISSPTIEETLQDLVLNHLL